MLNMNKNLYAELLSNISKMQEIVLDNYNNRYDYTKVSNEDKDKYFKFYMEIKKIFDSYQFNSDVLSLSMSMIYFSKHSSNLEEELGYLTQNFDTFEEWEKELKSLNSIIIIKDIQKNKNNLKDTKNEEKEVIKMSNIKINKITLSNFRFFTDDENNNTFRPNTHGMLIYGENGSGKSSLFKAFEFLSKIKINDNEFKDNKNIFKYEEPTSLNFEFSNNKSLSITDDNLVVDSIDTFITNLSIFKPILNYQELLKISYNEHNSISEQKNLYTFFEKILKDYPIVGSNKKLKDFEDEEYFEHYKRIIEEELFDSINHFLEKFKHSFKITKIKLSGVGKKAHLEIDYFEKDITDKKYHLFLNEARLSALAISIYFAIIKKQFDLLENDSLKILVLDDLLISLDMNNRLNLLKILQDEFSDYQIFFFTHEKGLFDLINEKMSLESYEIYVQKKDNIEVPFIKQSKSLLEQAIWQKDTQNYGCSANLLRQYTEKLVCKFLPKELILDRKCKVATLDALLIKAIKFESTKTTGKNQDIIDIFDKLKTYKRVLLNDASHYNSTEIYKAELEDAINSLEELKILLAI